MNSDTYSPMLMFTRDLLAMPNTNVNIERCGGRCRLRYRISDTETGKMTRSAVELPSDDDLAALIADIIASHRQARREGKTELRSSHHAEQQWRKTIRKRLVAACPHGRTLKRRLVLVFDLVADLGYTFLKDFLDRQPWLAKSPFRAGRRHKRL